MRVRGQVHGRRRARILWLSAGARGRCRAGGARRTSLGPDGPEAARGAAEEQGVAGETPNLAARLQVLAEPNTVVIASGTRRLTGQLFEYRNLGPMALKGFAELISAWQVLGHSTVESRFDALRATSLTPLVGRKDELETLLQRWQTAKAGQGQVVLLLGEPGIGKSRTTRVFAERLASEPHTRLSYFRSPHHQDSAFYSIIAQLERAAGRGGGDTSEEKLNKLQALLTQSSRNPTEEVPLLAELLSIPTSDRYPPLVLSPQRRKEKTLEALLSQLDGLAAGKPLLMIFEDVHWIDPTSRELLDLRVERVRALPILVIITFRPEFAPPWTSRHTTTMVLDRLDRQQVATLVERVSGKPLPARVLEQVIMKCDGVPLFAEEVTKAVMESELVVDLGDRYEVAGGVDTLTIPATLHDSLMARLDRLIPMKEVAQIGAAIGRTFSYELLAAVAPMNDAQLEAALTRITGTGLVFQNGVPPNATFMFKHALVQDAAYESLLKSRRQVLHQRIAEALRDSFPTIAEAEPEIVAYHFTRTNLTEAAAEWWGKAGERAVRSSAHNEAIAHLEKALALVDKLTEGPARTLQQLRLQTSYGYALLHGRGQTCADTMKAFARARELAAAVEDAAERTSIYWAMWVISYARAELSSMQELADAMLKDVQRSPDSPEVGIAHQVFGITSWFAGDYLSARAHLEQAVSAYSYERDHHLAARFGFDFGVLAMFILVRVLWGLGDVDRAVHLAEQGLSLALQTTHLPSIAFAQFGTCFFAALRRKPDQAAPHAQALVGLAREHGLPQWLAYGTFCLGWALCCAGDREGELRMREGLELLHEQQVHNNMRLFHVLLAEAEAESGRLEVGLATLSAEHEAIERTGERWFHAEVHRVRGELLLRRQPPDVSAAESAFMRAIEIARRQQTRSFELRAALALAKFYKTTGRGADAVLAPALDGFSPTPEFPEIAEALALLATSAA